jgi:hypothetical protein
MCQVSTVQGSTGQGSTGQGSTGQGSMGQVSTGQGSATMRVSSSTMSTKLGRRRGSACQHASIRVA